MFCVTVNREIIDNETTELPMLSFTENENDLRIHFSNSPLAIKANVGEGWSKPEESRATMIVNVFFSIKQKD